MQNGRGIPAPAEVNKELDVASIPTPNSGELLQRVDSAIKTSPHLTGHQVFCQEEDGVVVLHGKVKSFYQKQMAQEVLRRLDGIERIINELEVDWMGTSSTNSSVE
ncbi:MAG: BON domain-containing protein [Planctomycetota bacterium]|nr:MAG: BON domain-containing protein [Planctomycetota bacterium]